MGGFDCSGVVYINDFFDLSSLVRITWKSLIFRFGITIGILMMLDVSNICFRTLLLEVSIIAVRLSCDINFFIFTESIVKLSVSAKHSRRALLSHRVSDLPHTGSFSVRQPSSNVPSSSEQKLYSRRVCRRLIEKIDGCKEAH